jgi:hypothetical protein
MDTPEGGYREFYLENTELTKVRYRVSVLKGDVADISSNVEVYPKVLTVEPKSVGVLKVFAKASEGMEKRQYDFKLQFTPINIPTLSKAKEGNKITGSTQISISPVIGMKGYVGEANFEKNIRFEDIKVTKHEKEGIVVTGLLSNDSYIGIDFGIEAYGEGDYLYGVAHLSELVRDEKNRKIKLYFPKIKRENLLKKLVFYRTPSRVYEVIKTIEL